MDVGTYVHRSPFRGFRNQIEPPGDRRFSKNGRCAKVERWKGGKVERWIMGEYVFLSVIRHGGILLID